MVDYAFHSISTVSPVIEKEGEPKIVLLDLPSLSIIHTHEISLSIKTSTHKAGTQYLQVTSWAVDGLRHADTKIAIIISKITDFQLQPRGIVVGIKAQIDADVLFGSN